MVALYYDFRVIFMKQSLIFFVCLFACLLFYCGSLLLLSANFEKADEVENDLLIYKLLLCHDSIEQFTSFFICPFVVIPT